MSDGRTAICPGTYDPVTNGHLDIIGRTAKSSTASSSAWSTSRSASRRRCSRAEERRAFLERRRARTGSTTSRSRSSRTCWSSSRASTAPAAIVKGLRAISDFEYEFEMNQLNRKLAPEIESVYIIASPDYSFLSSTGRQGDGHLRRRRLRPRPGWRGGGAGRAPQALVDGVDSVGRSLQIAAKSGRRSTFPPLRVSFPHFMDVLVLIDKLDDLIHNARPVPLTDQVRVDREEIYDLLDQMRATIPEEIKQARWIVKERQEMLAEAKREAERVVKEARDQQARLISEEEVYKQAERAAEEIIEDARETERQIRLGAEDYADEILSTLEVNLEKFLAAVRRGRDRLAGREEEPAEVG